MKVYRYIDDDGNKIEDYNATLSDEGAKKVFKKLKKHTINEDFHMVIKDNSEETIEQEITKLQQFKPLRITFYPEATKFEKIPYSRRAGLDKVGKYITHYVMELSMEKLPFLYHVLFDDIQGMEKRRIEVIYDYISNKSSVYIIRLMKKYGKEEKVFDPHMSYEEKMAIIACFFDNLEMERVGVKEYSKNNLSDEDAYAYAYERIMDKLEYYKEVIKPKKRELNKERTPKM